MRDDDASQRSLDLLSKTHGGISPEDAIRKAARECLEMARTMGFIGPPFEPKILASCLNIRVLGSEGRLGADAVIAPDDSGRFHIVYDSSRPETRQNFSVAHEIGHALFPDCGRERRCRGVVSEPGTRLAQSAKRLEGICDIAASELLMPVPEFLASVAQFGGGLHAIRSVAEAYQVSLEAAALRLVGLSEAAYAVVVLEFRNKTHEVSLDAPKRLRVAYAFQNPTFRMVCPDVFIPKLKSVPDDSVAYDIFESDDTDDVADGIERWDIRRLTTGLHVSATCLPPAEDQRPRVLCLIRPQAP